MHARVVTFQAQPGKLDEFLRLFEDEFVGLLKEDEGFRSVNVFANHDTDRGVGIAVYASEADVKATESRFRERVAKAADLLVGRPVAEIYELSVEG